MRHSETEPEAPGLTTQAAIDGVLDHHPPGRNRRLNRRLIVVNKVVRRMKAIDSRFTPV